MSVTDITLVGMATTAAFFDLERPDNVPASIQDRAYTAPIWYTPADD